MEKFFYYIQTIIADPFKGFQQLLKNKNLNTFIIAYTVFIILHTLLQQFLSVKQVLPLYLSFVGVPIWFFSTYILHCIAINFSKKGSYKQLLATAAFIGFIGTIPLIMIDLLNYFIPNFFTFATILLSLFVTIYSMYLTFVALRSVYGVSKQQAITILLLQFSIFILLCVIIGIAIVIIYLSMHHPVLH